MSAFCQRLFHQNSLDQDSPKFFLAKVSSFTGKDIDTTTLYKYRIYSKHFVSKKPADLYYDSTNPGWLPSLDLGYEKRGNSFSSGFDAVELTVERWKRVQERDRWREVKELLSTVVNNELEFIIEEELEMIAAEEIRFAKEFESIIKEEIEVTAAEQLEIA